MSRVVQLRQGELRRIAAVEGDRLRLLEPWASVHALALAALAAGRPASELAARAAGSESLDYGAVHRGDSPWRLLPPIDFPGEPARCLVSGTGLTHLGSARNRQAMHAAAAAEMTDSMRMFEWGREGGRPEPGRIGTPPEWFFKGRGDVLRAHGEPLPIARYAEDGGEEAEIAGAYVIGPDGRPYRVGMAVGNEFSDHVFEKRNYLNLAGSKLRPCSLGPELSLDPAFDSVPGRVSIERDGSVIWEREIRTGEREMCHSLRNIEHHHFKFEAHRRPGDVHVHYYGADRLSFADGVRLRHGDAVSITFEGFGRPLRNPIVAEAGPDQPVAVRSLNISP